jgi:flagellar biosynthetic protein FliP
LGAFGLPAVTSVEELNGETTYSLSLQILLLMTALTVLPSLVLGMTAFTRIIIVLSILRQALGTQQTPPNQVLIAVALFLSFYVMSPIFDVLYVDILTPYLDGNLEMNLALSQGFLGKSTLYRNGLPMNGYYIMKENSLEVTEISKYENY